VPKFFSYLSWLQILLLMVGLMSGIFSLFREVFLINHPEKAQNAHLFWRCVFITFIISAVSLWVSERQKTLDLKARLDELTKPGFVVESGRQMSAFGNNITTTFLSVRITNRGADSAIFDYEAYFQSKSQPSPIRLKTIAPTLVGPLKLRYPNGRWYEIPASGLIYNRKELIHRGDYIAGLMPIEIPGDRRQEFTDPDTIVTIKVKDYTGNWTSGYFHGTTEGSSGDPAIVQGEAMPMPTSPPEETQPGEKRKVKK